VLHVARRRPEALIIGVDTAAEAMRETSRRAARRPGAGGAPNALFLVGDATRLDGLEVLAGRVDVVREQWLADDRFTAVEVMVAEDASVVIATRR